jgi:nucleoside-diphosphate-sugar epimerase
VRLAVTGASGFVGQALAAHLTELGLAGDTLLIDRSPFAIPGFACVHHELTSEQKSLEILRNIEVVCHLAALPGAAAEADPTLSRQVNCDLPLSLIECLAGKRLIIASSIAVYGSEFGSVVDDATPARPNSVYATHKRMVELAYADAVRRGTISGVALRLAGIVARPPEATGFGSAFLSEVFHAVLDGQDYALPVAADATSWIVSGQACARQLAHAMLDHFTAGEALLIPATHARMQDLVSEIGKRGDPSRVTFAEQPTVRRTFGSHPLMAPSRAMELGFEGAETLAELVEAALPRV